MIEHAHFESDSHVIRMIDQETLTLHLKVLGPVKYHFVLCRVNAVNAACISTNQHQINPNKIGLVPKANQVIEKTSSKRKQKKSKIRSLMSVFSVI